MQSVLLLLPGCLRRPSGSKWTTSPIRPGFPFYYLGLCWVFIATRSLLSSCSEWAPFSSCIPGLLIAVASLAAARRRRVTASVTVVRGLSNCGYLAPEHWLSSWGAPASVSLQHMGSSQTRDEPGVSPVLAGKFFTTEPPGKAWDFPVLGLKLPHLGRTCSSKQIGMASRLTEYTILKELYTRVATRGKLGKEHDGLLKSYTLRTLPLGNNCEKLHGYEE